jgi:hypothetical protein
MFMLNIGYMKKSTGIAIVIVLLLLVIGGTFFLSQKSSSKTTGAEEKTETTQQGNQIAKPEGVQGSIKSLLASGKTNTCTFSKTTNDVTIKGTVYTGNGKVREDFSSTAANSTMNGHMIVDGKIGYMWNDAMKGQGYKFDMTAGQPTSSTSGKSQVPDINQDINFSCQGWTLDASVFALPTDVTFTSFSMPGAVTTRSEENPIQGQGGDSSACGACNSIPAGAGRDSCKTQLHCQ